MLRLENAAKSFGDHAPVLAGIDLEFPAGQGLLSHAAALPKTLSGGT